LNPALSVVCDDAPKYVFREDKTDPCQVRYRVFNVGARLGAEWVYEMVDNKCQAPPQLRPREVHRVDEEVKPDWFVRMSLVADTSFTESVSLLVFQGEDGSVERVGWQDEGRNERCFSGTLEDDRLHCVPSTLWTQATFADTACSRPLVSSRCEPAPQLGQKLPPGACVAERPIYKLGSPVAMAYQMADNMCAPAMPSADRSYRPLEERVPDDTFPTMERTTLPGSERLRRRGYVVPGGRSTHAVWFDSARDEECSPTRVGDAYRCLSGVPDLTQFYADDRCTQPISVNFSQCLGPAKYALVLADFATRCSRSRAVVRVGEPYTGPAFFGAPDHREPSMPRWDCQPFSLREGWRAYRTEPVASSEFVEFRLIEH
jgi:hypothetical protein